MGAGMDLIKDQRSLKVSLVEKHKEMQAQIVEEITRFLQTKDTQIDDISAQIQAQRESNHTQAKAASELDQSDKDIFKGTTERVLSSY